VIYADVSFGTIAKPIQEVTAFVGPFGITFRHASSFETMGQHILLRFLSKPKRVVTADLKSKDITTVHMLVSFNIHIIRDLIIAKQRSQRAI
jgi:hypothetical protein